MKDIDASGLLEGFSDDDKADIMAEVDSLTRIVELTRLVERMLLDIWNLRADVSTLTHLVDGHIKGFAYDPKHDPDESCLKEALESLVETKHYGDYPENFDVALQRLLKSETPT
jgi:hypothetical protein